jgi:hypothetical protein
MMMSKSISWEEDSMQILIACVIIITCLAIYIPVIYIRKTNKLQKILEQIEANTHK